MSRALLIRDLLGRPQAHRYGAHRCQRADLHLPAGPGPHPVAVTIHGGSWVARYGKLVMRALAADLARRGWAAWNIEYRRVGRGQGGGWPATLLDVAAAIDHLPDVPAPLDLERVVVVGHSAGGQLALWAAGRGKLAPGAPGEGPRVSPHAVVSQAGVNDLASSYRECRGGAVLLFLGRSPEQAPERYEVADPIGQVPLEQPVLLVHGVRDATVSIRRSRDYARAAGAAGGHVELVEIEGPQGAHRRHIDPDGHAWSVVTGWLEQWRGG